MATAENWGGKKCGETCPHRSPAAPAAVLYYQPQKQQGKQCKHVPQHLGVVSSVYELNFGKNCFCIWLFIQHSLFSQMTLKYSHAWVKGYLQHSSCCLSLASVLEVYFLCIWSFCLAIVVVTRSFLIELIWSFVLATYSTSHTNIFPLSILRWHSSFSSLPF